jgi:hypothetical protein
VDGDRVIGRLDAKDRGPAAGGPDVVEEKPDRGRLARAVRTQEAEYLASGHGQVDVDHAAVLAVVLGQLLGLDDNVHITSFHLKMGRASVR